MKEYLKPHAYKQVEHYFECDTVLFVERAGELRYVARLRNLSFGAAAKASLNRALSSML